MRGLLGELVDTASDIAVADMEAGLEHLSRGTPRPADTVLAVLEPYFRSLETGARVMGLARELGVAKVLAVANKVRDRTDCEAVEGFCRARSISLLSVGPHDKAVLEADREGGALLDRAPQASSVQAMKGIAERLLG